jgi:tetratricopeptide (TPR) repeat protein
MPLGKLPPTCASSCSTSSNDPDARYFDLGDFHRQISTNSPIAQVWFDRGLVWCYGFNKPEAFACFEKCVEADPECAMGYWGLAYSSSAYYNKPWALFDSSELKETVIQAHGYVCQANERLSGATGVERALVHAMQVRFPKAGLVDMSAMDSEYANAMESVYQNFGDDLDVIVLFAESLMNKAPWRLWDPYTGEPTPGVRTLDAKIALEHAFTLKGAYEHPGLLHMYIHLMEMSREPEKAMKAGDSLRRLVPESGHLNHMPTHLDVLVGDYRGAIVANKAAVRMDELYANETGCKNRYALYRAHNLHSLVYAAMLSGQSKVALEGCDMIEKALPHDLVGMQHPPMADWLEGFVSVRAHVLIRFGLWDEILNMETPEDNELYCVTSATIHYAKGVAWAATGHVPEAEKEQALFLRTLATVPESRLLWPNRCIDILKVGEAMLAGEIEYRRGNFDSAFGHLRSSIYLDDHLNYAEPWGWMQPTRHAYAALLLEQGRAKEAADAYAADLGFDSSLPRGHQHPNNVWALHGYHECLNILGRYEEARLLELPLKVALSTADVPIASSCFCRNLSQSDCSE